MSDKRIGSITHYFGKIGVAVIELTEDSLHVGDTIHILGRTSDFTQRVESMQIEHHAVDAAEKGQSVGMKVSAHAHEHDSVFKVLPD